MILGHKHSSTNLRLFVVTLYTVFQKKTSAHIIGYKLRNSCLILIIFDTKISHII